MSDLGEILPPLLEGLLNSLKVGALASAVAVLLSFAAGLALLSRLKLVTWPVRLYVELFRGTPLLVQIFFFFFVLPLFGLRLSPLTAAVAALGLSFAAYGAEIVRSSILAIDRGQWEACHALSIGRTHALRRIIVPQAVRRMIPPFGNLSVEMIKSTSLISLVGIAELTFAGKLQTASTGEGVLIYSLVMGLYFCVGFPLALLVKRSERRFAEAW